jgi:hypothetical protein
MWRTYSNRDPHGEIFHEIKTIMKGTTLQETVKIYTHGIKNVYSNPVAYLQTI